MTVELRKVFDNGPIQLYVGDVFDCLQMIPNNIIQTVVTSPTYWGKRKFTKDDREFGSEKLEVYVDRNVKLYSTILDKIKDDGSLFIVIQDTYMGSGVSRSHQNYWVGKDSKKFKRIGIDSNGQGNTSSVTAHHPIIKNKSLSGIPYRIALRLVDMGYIWREQIIWEKPNPMPENITDRTRQSSEFILHFVKNGKYKFNPEPYSVKTLEGKKRLDNQVWKYAPEPRDGHTATFPSKMVERLMLATSDEGDVVFDPFLGSGTMLNLALKHNRRFIGCDINSKFVELAISNLKKHSFPAKEITGKL